MTTLIFAVLMAKKIKLLEKFNANLSGLMRRQSQPKGEIFRGSAWTAAEAQAARRTLVVKTNGASGTQVELKTTESNQEIRENQCFVRERRRNSDHVVADCDQL